MTEGSQSQRAGSNSQQFQFFGDVNMVGVTEERAREISRESFREMIVHYSAESHAVANGRVEKFDERYIQQLATGGLLGALTDPAFQVTLRKAQLGAASTDREADYDLLASLLHDRATREHERPIRAGVNRAVEIVDQLDDEALTGLTLFSLVTTLTARGHSLDRVLDLADQSLAQVMEGRTLPTGSEWIEHLEILDAIRIDSGITFADFSVYWSDKYGPWVSMGAVEGSEEDLRGRAHLAALNFPVAPSSHPLKPGYSWLNVDVTERLLEEWEASGVATVRLEAIKSVAREIYRVTEKDEGCVSAFMTMARSRPHQRALEEWWDSISDPFHVTVVGKVLSRANVKTLDTLGIIPPL